MFSFFGLGQISNSVIKARIEAPEKIKSVSVKTEKVYLFYPMVADLYPQIFMLLNAKQLSAIALTSKRFKLPVDKIREERFNAQSDVYKLCSDLITYAIKDKQQDFSFFTMRSPHTSIIYSISKKLLKNVKQNHIAILVFSNSVLCLKDYESKSKNYIQQTEIIKLKLKEYVEEFVAHKAKEENIQSSEVEAYKKKLTINIQASCNKISKVISKWLLDETPKNILILNMEDLNLETMIKPNSDFMRMIRAHDQHPEKYINFLMR